MDNEHLRAQYDQFISQLRVEVDQTFWLYNFFFAVDSALLGTVFLKQIDKQRLLIAIIFGIILSVYWLWIMEWKNKWRKHWLKRIIEIERGELKILEKLQMWPDNFGPPRGLWKALFWLPIGFIFLWFGMLLYYAGTYSRFNFLIS